jgi:hypothetical protein
LLLQAYPTLPVAFADRTPLQPMSLSAVNMDQAASKEVFCDDKKSQLIQIVAAHSGTNIVSSL